MSKLPFFLLPTLLASTSALALSCYDGSTGCIDTAQASKDCLNLGYSLNEPECEHYLLCPFNTDYKICVKEKAGDTPTPTPDPDPTPSYNCDDMARKLKNAASYKYYRLCIRPEWQDCDSVNTCNQANKIGIGYVSSQNDCLATLFPLKLFGQKLRLNNQEMCLYREQSFKDAIEEHNKHCPPLDIKPSFECNNCIIGDQDSTCVEDESVSFAQCPNKANLISWKEYHSLSDRQKNDPCYEYKLCFKNDTMWFTQTELEGVYVNLNGQTATGPQPGYTYFQCKKK